MVTTEPIRAVYKVARDQSTAIPVVYVTEDDQIPEFLAWAARLEKKILLVDIETDGSTKDGLDWHTRKIATLQVGNPLCKEPRAYVFCIRSLSAAALEPVLALFADPAYKKLGQNIRFEIIWLLNKYGVRFENVFCTQVAELVLRAGLFPITKGSTDSDGHNRKAYGETSMAALGRRYLGVQIEKGEHVRLRFWTTPPGQLSTDQLVYAAGDVVYPAFIAREQKREIMDRGLASVIGIEMDLIPILADSEHAGINIDADAWTDLCEQAVQEQEEAKRELDELLLPAGVQADIFGRTVAKPTAPTITQGGRIVEVNYNAPAQMQRMLVRYLQHISWPIQPITRLTDLMRVKREFGEKWLERHPGKVVADIPDWVIPEDQYVVLLNMDSKLLRIARARKQLPNALIDPYLRFRDASKRVASYGMKFLDSVDPRTGRIHVNWHQAITTTGRMSAEPGIQTIPRTAAYRACFRPRPGWKFVLRDFSQIEPRLSAEVSGDPLYRSIFSNGEDIYVRVGEEQTKQKIDKKTEAGKILRQGFKTTVLATAYNMGSRKLRDNLTLNLEPFILSGVVEPPTFEMATLQLKGFFEVAPKIKEFQDRCIKQADPETGPKIYDRYLRTEVTYVTAPCGRKRFFRPDAKNVYTESPNAPIQGSSATITKLSAVLLWRRARDAGVPVHFVNYMHDELIIEVPEEHAELASEWLREAMEAAGRRYIKSVPVLAEAAGTGVFDYWFKE